MQARANVTTVTLENPAVRVLRRVFSVRQERFRQVEVRHFILLLALVVYHRVELFSRQTNQANIPSTLPKVPAQTVRLENSIIAW